MIKNKIAIIVEGVSTEPKIFDNIKRIFFENDLNSFEFIVLPADQNIYMLSERLKKDDYETDVIDLIKEINNGAHSTLEELDHNSFKEIYLFFDYDPHANNFNDKLNREEILNNMMQTFDNETENGKLYISYPMVEALRAIPDDLENCLLKCNIKLDECVRFKEISALSSSYTQVKKYKKEQWKTIVSYYVNRIECLLQNRKMTYNYKAFSDLVSVAEIHKMQLEKYFQPYQRIFILSGIPLFLIQYFGEEIWNEFNINMTD